jgi:hypothetical protein
LWPRQGPQSTLVQPPANLHRPSICIKSSPSASSPPLQASSIPRSQLLLSLLPSSSTDPPSSFIRTVVGNGSGLPTPSSNLPTPPPLPRLTLPARLHGHLEANSASPSHHPTSRRPTSRRPTKARKPLGEASAPPERGWGGEHASTLRLWVGFLSVRWRPPSRRGRGLPATSECSR